MKKKPSTADPLRKSISVNFTDREYEAFVRLGNRNGSRSAQVRDCLDLEKVAEKIRQSDELPRASTSEK
jgi:hypothetical protein